MHTIQNPPSLISKPQPETIHRNPNSPLRNPATCVLKGDLVPVLDTCRSVSRRSGGLDFCRQRGLRGSRLSAPQRVEVDMPKFGRSAATARFGICQNFLAACCKSFSSVLS